MENSFCFKILFLLGVHPYYTMNKLRVTFSNLLTACIMSLAIFKCYLNRDLEIVEAISALNIVIVKYLTLAFGRKTIKRILEAMELFWKVNAVDEQVTYLIRHFKGVEKIYKYIFIFAIVIYAVGPFISNASSIFNCYIPPHVPFPLFYLVEFYVLLICSFVFTCFNILVCFLIVFVTVQFRLTNLKIKDLNFGEVESDQDVDVYVRNLRSMIQHQQFLMRCVDDLNKLLGVPIALLMVTNVSLMCISMYNITMNQGSISDKVRMFVIIFIMVAEFFMVYGLPAQLLLDESAAIADTVYSECKWYSSKLQHIWKDFFIVIIRSQRSVCIRAGNYHIINNATVLLMVKSAYTFYAFLQKVT